MTLDLLLEKIRQNSGYDFREYKHGTVTRRLERRLHATCLYKPLDIERVITLVEAIAKDKR